jgi:hypothetical protein
MKKSGSGWLPAIIWVSILIVMSLELFFLKPFLRTRLSYFVWPVFFLCALIAITQVWRALKQRGLQ